MNRTFLVLAAAGLMGTGCAHSGERPVAEAGELASDDVMVQVSNNNWHDMTIYAVSNNGVRQRLGRVTSMTQQTFRLPRALLVASNVRLMADPLGSTRTHLSPELLIQPGSRVVWQLENTLSLSNAMVLGRRN